MSKLKILLVCEQPLPSKRRAGRPNYTVDHLSKWGHELTVICPKSSEPLHSEEGSVNYEYVDAKYEQFSIASRLKIMRAFKKKVHEALRQDYFDIIRTINIVPTYVALNIRGRDVPIYAELTDFLSDLYTQFDMPFKSLAVRMIKRMEKKIAKKVDYANVETPIGRHLWEGLGLSSEKIAVIPNGVDTKHFSPKGEDGRVPREELKIRSTRLIVYHGDIGRLDGLEYLIQAFALLKREDVDLMIIGDGPKSYMNELKKLASKHGIKKRTIFTGWIDYSILPDYLALAEVGVVPIIPSTGVNRSNFHTRIREYIAMYKKFVVTETEGIKSMIKDLPIYIKDPENIRELTSKISEALEFSLDDRTVGLMKSIAEKLDWKNIVRHDEALMSHIANNSLKNASKHDLVLL